MPTVNTKFRVVFSYLQKKAEPKKLSIGLDFDRSYTSDPELFDHFIAQAKERGHNLAITTSRTDDEVWGPEVKHAIKDRVPIVFGGYYNWKDTAAKGRGHDINTWIDDNPEYITNMTEEDEKAHGPRYTTEKLPKKNYPDRVTYGINYEDTIAHDPDFYHDFINKAKSRGHKVVVYSHHEEDHEKAPHIRRHARDMGACGTVFAGPTGWADDAAHRGNHKVDVWMGARLHKVRPTPPSDKANMNGKGPQEVDSDYISFRSK